MMKARYIYKAKFKIFLMQLNDVTTYQLKAENSAVEWCKQGTHKAKSIIYSRDDVSQAKKNEILWYKYIFAAPSTINQFI